MHGDSVLFTNDALGAYTRHFLPLVNPDGYAYEVFNKQTWRQRVPNANIVTQMNAADKNNYVKQLIGMTLTDPNMCGNVGKDYIDWVFLLSEHNYNDKDIDYLVTEVDDGGIKKVCSMLLAHKGECKEPANRNTWVVQIICNSKLENPRPPLAPSRPCNGHALFLLGAYCYALRNAAQPMGLLEVAYGYRNGAAVCLYDKLGFIETGDVDQKSCKVFHPTSIEMATDINSLSYESIVETVKTGVKMRCEGSNCQPVPKIFFCRASDADRKEIIDYTDRIIYAQDQLDPTSGQIVKTTADIKNESKTMLERIKAIYS
jgi:hypothetical protein